MWATRRSSCGRRQGCRGRRRDAVRSPASREPAAVRTEAWGSQRSRIEWIDVLAPEAHHERRVRSRWVADEVRRWQASHASSRGSDVAARSKVTDGLARLEAASTMPATSLDARGAELLFEVLTERQDTHPLRRWPTCRSANGVRSPQMESDHRPNRRRRHRPDLTRQPHIGERLRAGRRLPTGGSPGRFHERIDAARAG